MSGNESDALDICQEAMDTASMSVGGATVLADRVKTKANESKRGYSSGSWDLVDAMENEDFELDKLKKEELPQEMKNMSTEEQKAYIETKTKERKGFKFNTDK